MAAHTRLSLSPSVGQIRELPSVRTPPSSASTSGRTPVQNSPPSLHPLSLNPAVPASSRVPGAPENIGAPHLQPSPSPRYPAGPSPNAPFDAGQALENALHIHSPKNFTSHSHYSPIPPESSMQPEINENISSEDSAKHPLRTHLSSSTSDAASSIFLAPKPYGARPEEHEVDRLPENFRILVTRDFDVGYFLNLSRLANPALIRSKLYARLGINEEQNGDWQLFRFSNSQLKSHPLDDLQVWDLCLRAHQEAILLVLVIRPIYPNQNLMSSLPAQLSQTPSRSTSSLSSSERYPASRSSGSQMSLRFKTPRDSKLANPYLAEVPPNATQQGAQLTSYHEKPKLSLRGGPSFQNSASHSSSDPVSRSDLSNSDRFGSGPTRPSRHPASIPFNAPSSKYQVRENRSASASQASALGATGFAPRINNFLPPLTDHTHITSPNLNKTNETESALCQQRVPITQRDGPIVKHDSPIYGPNHLKPDQHGDRVHPEHSSCSNSSHHTHPLPKPPNKTAPAISLIQTAVSKIGTQISNFKSTHSHEKNRELNPPQSSRLPHERVQALNFPSHGPHDSRPPLAAPKTVPVETRTRHDSPQLDIGAKEGTDRARSVALKRGDAIRWGAPSSDPAYASYDHHRRMSSAQYTSSPDSNLLSSPVSTRHSISSHEGTQLTLEKHRRTSQTPGLAMRDEIREKDYARSEKADSLDDPFRKPIPNSFSPSDRNFPLLAGLGFQPVNWGPSAPLGDTEGCTVTPKNWAEMIESRGSSMTDEVNTPEVMNGCLASIDGNFSEEDVEDEEGFEVSGEFQVPMKGSKEEGVKQQELAKNESSTDEREPGAGLDWALRPGVVEVYERIDKLFPDYNLDEPIDLGPGSPVSENSTREPRQSSAARPNVLNLDVDGAIPRLKSHAIGRARSIRVVAEERKRSLDESHITKSEAGQPLAEKAHEGDRMIKSVSPPGKLSTVGLSRHKSAKLWGVRTEEVPPPGQGPGQKRSNELEHTRSTNGDAQSFSFKWVKGQLIGRGSFGEVYLALNITKGDMLAVKRVKMTSGTPQKKKLCEEGQSIAVAALRSEVHLLKDLEHPNIVQYLGFEETAEFASIFLEYVPGGSIGSCLRSHGAFELPITKFFTMQTLKGLIYLHTANILHRDLKADNILVDLNGNCKISDFGISKQSNDAYQTNTSMSFQGTVFYMAPEVVRNPEKDKKGYSAKADIWSLGCVVLEMMCGRRPWSGTDQIQALFKLGADRTGPPIPGDVKLDKMSNHFLEECFASNPRERPMADKLALHRFLIMDPSWKFQDSHLYRAICIQKEQFMDN